MLISFSFVVGATYRFVAFLLFSNKSVTEQLLQVMDMLGPSLWDIWNNKSNSNT